MNLKNVNSLVFGTDRSFIKDGDLSLGFSLGDLERYVYDNEEEIRETLSSYGFSVADILSMDNYYDISNILDVDSTVLKGVELSVITDTIHELLSEGLNDSKDKSTIVDLLWVLHSSGIPYDSRRSLGVSKEDYKEYLLGLVNDNGLGSFVEDSVTSYSDLPFDYTMLRDLEKKTGYLVTSFKDGVLEVVAPDVFEEAFVVKTSGLSFDEVVKAVLSHHIKDSSDPHTSWKTFVYEDFKESVEQDWSDEDVNIYLSDVVQGYTTPDFLFRVGGATDGHGDVIENSDFLTSFLAYTEDSIRGYQDLGLENLYTEFLLCYEAYFRELRD